MARIKTTGKISLIIAASPSIVMLAVLLYIHFVITGLDIWLLITVPLIMLAGGFFLVRKAFNSFIRMKMSPLHHALLSLNPGTGSGKKDSVTTDIIDEMEEEVMDWAKKKKSELEKMKDMETYRKEFLGNIYHELKTPIFNLQGYILTLMEGGLDDPDINKLYLERSERNINRMISIVEDLESISGLESGALNLRIETFSIRKTIREVFESNEIRARKLNIRLEMSRLKEKDEMVKGDKKRIYQVLNNLVMNSINYGIKNGKTEVNLSPADNKIYIEVKDNGIGINSEDLHRIFERFYRVDKSRSRDTGGTGLGLSIVKHIIEAHKQTIRVNSVPGKGSSFIFTLDRG